MKILADTNLFIKFHRQLPLPKPVVMVLESDVVERCLSPISIVELFRLWKGGRVPLDPDAWLDNALESWTILPVTVPIARQSVLWDWTHKDPADRILAATAQIEKIELWHTDTTLKKLRGFPQRYFTNKG
ncbi:MAG: PIN domain-containing protein [Limisphaerales bacterium]